jgi:hypothetical protein
MGLTNIEATKAAAPLCYQNRIFDLIKDIACKKYFNFFQLSGTVLKTTR